MMIKGLIRLTGLFVVIALIASGCTTINNIARKNPPPGQMKKITGSQSAKSFAPGQRGKPKNK